jgi:hypothetical protein
MTEAGGRAATMVICDLILPEKVWQTLTERIRSMLLGLGKMAESIGRARGLQSERPRLLSYTCPFRASGLGHPAKRRVDPNLSDRKYGSIVVKNYSWR